jgi:hypothetical protein
LPNGTNLFAVNVGGALMSRAILPAMIAAAA